MLINWEDFEAKVEKAMTYLSDTDEEYARSSAYVKMAYYLKLIKATHFLNHTGTVAERESEAFSSVEYKKWLDRLDEMTVKAETMESKRESAQREVDIWRTMCANQRT